jgi:hypothetical protein
LLRSSPTTGEVVVALLVLASGFNLLMGSKELAPPITLA